MDLQFVIVIYDVDPDQRDNNTNIFVPIKEVDLGPLNIGVLGNGNKLALLQINWIENAGVNNEPKHNYVLVPYEPRALHDQVPLLLLLLLVGLHLSLTLHGRILTGFCTHRIRLVMQFVVSLHSFKFLLFLLLLLALQELSSNIYLVSLEEQVIEVVVVC